MGALNCNDALIALACQHRGIPAIASVDPDFDQVPWRRRLAHPDDVPVQPPPSRPHVNIDHGARDRAAGIAAERIGNTKALFAPAPGSAPPSAPRWRPCPPGVFTRTQRGAAAPPERTGARRRAAWRSLDMQLRMG